MTRTLGMAMMLLVVAGWAVAADAAEPAGQPAKELKLDLGKNVTMKLVLIPAGKFLMGSPETEKGRQVDETQREVTIGKAFYMGTTHVTVDEFAAFVKDTAYKTDAEKDGWTYGFEINYGRFDVKKVPGGCWRKPSFEQKGNHPVVLVSWNDANAFCEWLSKKSGSRVVLPTEEQWEYACRAGTTTAYPWGDNPDDGKGWANCADQRLKTTFPNSRDLWRFFSWDDGFAFTSPVASFNANAFGLFDMIGNAWQLCSDRDGDHVKRADEDAAGADRGGRRVSRGAGWNAGPELCRSGRRFACDPDHRLESSGFRVAVMTAGTN